MNTFHLPVRFRMFLIAVLITLPVVSVDALPGSQASAAQRSGDPIIARAVETILSDPQVSMGFQGVFIQSLSDHRVLYETNAEKVFLPASNNKLLTSGAALELLGPDFVYRTRLYRVGDVDPNGVLKGELVLVGAGDPVLAPADLEALAHQAALAGVRQVTGDLIYDDTLFDQQVLGDTWAWDDEPFYYSAQISALNLNENLVDVKVAPGKSVGDPAIATITPTDRYMQIVNTATTGSVGSKSALTYDRVRGKNTLLIGGALPIDADAKNSKPEGLTMEDPARFTAFVLREALERAGVHVQGGLTAATPPLSPTAVLVAEHRSAPLTAIVKRMNKPSDNLIAECLLKTVGAVKKGKGTGGADGTGAQAAREFFKRIGFNLDGLHQADGSGLSRTNFVSPHNLVRLLTYLHTRPEFEAFYNSLPIAGVDGSLAGRMRGTSAEKNCHAKTGYVSNVSSLTGYVTTKEGELLVFSIMMNNHLARNRTCTALQDRIVALLADYRRPGKLARSGR